MRQSAWRIFKPKHAATAFTGEGARLYGGRWNTPGNPVVYTAGSVSLAALEMLVHLSSHQVLESYLVCEVRFDETVVATIDAAELPADWRSDPAPLAVQRIGDEWIEAGTSAVLWVPSAIVDTEFNFLLNPAHPEFAAIAIGEPASFRFDPRLVK